MIRALAIMALCLSAAPAHAVPAPVDDGRTLAFDLYRAGKKAGTHAIRFRQQGAQLQVDVSIRLAGRMFLVPFSYTHSNQELWQGERLVRIETRTATNNKVETVRGQATGAGFEVRAGAAQAVLPAIVLPTSYWHPNTPNQTALLNSQKGSLARITTEQIVSTTAQTPLGTRAANEYRFTGGVKANVVYDGSGCLVGLSFKMPVDGSPVVYRMTMQPDAARAPDLLANPLLAPCLKPPLRTALR